MTFKQTQRELAALGVSLRHDTEGEYRVAFAGRNQEAGACYTPSLEDARGTAFAMLEHSRVHSSKRS